ncbi:MAG TPA: twin-arginine translocase TatA/TatE family subunit [Actinomycetota bacterium]|jgi:sec-independent protein translocase protein TatA|nr:twin-arginine translocase TatA/TatE family subunit [Actinomycetota bacterium]
MNLGPGEIMLVVGAIVLLFGAKKLPEFARSLGKAKKEFKEGLSESNEAEAEETKTAKPE